MSDFTEVTRESWGSRLGNSIKSVLIGLVLFVVAFPVLFWNEGRAVKRDKDIKEGAAGSIVIDPAKIDSANEKKMVFAAGVATTTEKLQDDTFPVSANAIRLNRVVQMYQWKETIKEERKKEVGGSEKVTKTPVYDKVWSEKVLDSTNYKDQSRVNPPVMPFSSASWKASKITLGAFTLPDALVDKIQGSAAVRMTTEAYAQMSSELKNRFRLQPDGTLYASTPTTASTSPPPAETDKASIGDVKISFQMTPPSDVALSGDQVGSSFASHKTQTGQQFLELKTGKFTKETFFDALAKDNALTTWLLRLLGFAMMFIGLMMIASPIAVFGDVVPLIGGFLRAGAGLFAFLIAAAFSFITIAIAWVAYRPLVGIPMLVIGIGAIVLLKVKSKGSKPAAVPPGVAR